MKKYIQQFKNICKNRELLITHPVFFKVRNDNNEIGYVSVNALQPRIPYRCLRIIVSIWMFVSSYSMIWSIVADILLMFKVKIVIFFLFFIECK